MKLKIKVFVYFTLIGLCFSLFFNRYSFAQVTPTSTPTPTPDANTTITPTPTNTQNNDEEIKKLNDKISFLEGKINDLKKQENSLSSQIEVMDNQIQLTQYRINVVQEQINETTLDIDTAGKKIKNLEGSLSNVTKVLLSRIVATYQAGEIEPVRILLASSNLQEFLSRENYLKIVQEHDKELLYNTQQAKVDYANQKILLESKKKKILALQSQLDEYNKELDQEKNIKQDLLSVTKNDEDKYQKLLAEARAQIQAFKSFATSKVGTGGSILPAQPSPDGWFFNQRDERWGRNFIGSSSDPVWEVGCLLTSVAMVLKKHGNDVTPGNIAANSSYYFSNTAYMLIPWGGGAFSSTWGADLGNIDSKLSSGEPVIVGVRAGPYGMHFIVLKSGSSGGYIMNDPWNGPDLKFADYYTTGQIFQYGWYSG